MPGALLGQGLGALFWRASDLDNVTREALGHHVEACFAACFPREGTGRGAPGAQEFIVKATQELQEARTIRGDRRPPPGVAPRPGEDSELRVYFDISGLNRAASQERFWPSSVGRCEGPPHSYVCMPFGLPNAAATFQRLMQGALAARESRHQASLMEEESEPPGSLENRPPDDS